MWLNSGDMMSSVSPEAIVGRMTIQHGVGWLVCWLGVQSHAGPAELWQMKSLPKMVGVVCLQVLLLGCKVPKFMQEQ